MLMMVFVLSSFLDNIAAALIGGAIAHQLFRGKVHIGDLAAIVAAANADGAGSVVGGTTTTMLWISGGKASQVFDAYAAAVVALLVCDISAPFQQHNDEIGFFAMLVALGWHPDASIKQSEVVIPASVPTVDASPANISR